MRSLKSVGIALISMTMAAFVAAIVAAAVPTLSLTAILSAGVAVFAVVAWLMSQIMLEAETIERSHGKQFAGRDR